LVLFFKKEPLSLPLAFRGGDLHSWAATRKEARTFAKRGSLYPEETAARFGERYLLAL
jgi:hypothetical protein